MGRRRITSATAAAGRRPVGQRFVDQQRGCTMAMASPGAKPQSDAFEARRGLNSRVKSRFFAPCSPIGSCLPGASSRRDKSVRSGAITPPGPKTPCWGHAWAWVTCQGTDDVVCGKHSFIALGHRIRISIALGARRHDPRSRLGATMRHDLVCIKGGRSTKDPPA